MYLIVGLGNPGREYAETRHNAGCMALEEIARRVNATPNRLRFKGQCGEAVMDGRRVLLLFPLTYMNNSGESIREIVSFYKIPVENIIIINDDITLVISHITHFVFFNIPKSVGYKIYSSFFQSINDLYHSYKVYLKDIYREGKLFKYYPL